jgi:N utilization substance protein B
VNQPRTHRSARSKARSRALTVLFESEVRGLALDGTLQQRLDDQDPPVADYTVTLVRGVVDHQDEIDELLGRYSQEWSLTRMPALDRNALRLALFEMRHTEVPDEVAIDEAVELVTELSTDDSPAFVNGVLGAILRDGTHRLPDGA